MSTVLDDDANDVLDHDTREALRDLRERFDGSSPDEDATLARALRRATVRRRSPLRWVLLPIAATFVVSAAWAGTTGRLGAVAARALHTLVTVQHARKPAFTKSVPVVPTASIAPSALEPVPAEVPGPRPSAAVPHALPPNDATSALFAEAHRLHFVEHDMPRALSAWDAYLAADPAGRFAPEARYNRAVVLVRLGRTAEARAALQPFADHVYGTYRANEARALLDALP